MHVPRATSGPQEAKRLKPPGNPIAMLVAVQEAGGTLRVHNPSPRDRARWRSLINRLIRSGDLPDGLCLRHTGRDRGNLTLRLVPLDQAPHTRSSKALIVIPDNLQGLHPVLRATQDAARTIKNGWVDTRHIPDVLAMRVTTHHVPRALKAVQGLVTAAAHRGHAFVLEARTNGMTRAGLKIQGHFLELAVWEETDTVKHVATPAESRTPWMAPPWDYLPTGRLAIRTDHPTYGDLVNDRQRWRLEDRLPRALTALEAIAEGLEARRLAEQVRRQEAQEIWERALARAKAQLIEHHRIAWLRHQLTHARLAHEVRAFVVAARTSTQSAEGLEWLEWVEQYADRIDPIANLLPPPPAPQPSAANLEPYLKDVHRPAD